MKRLLPATVAFAGLALGGAGEAAKPAARGDGIVDDTAALQKAIDAVQEDTGEGVVLVHEGRYRLSGTRTTSS